MIELCPQDQIDRVLEYFAIRFGVDEAIFDSYKFYSGPHGRIFLGPYCSFEIVIDTTGLLIARIHRTVKPSSDFFQSFGKYVKLNIVTISYDHVPLFCQGKVIELDTVETNNSERGFVMVSYNNLPLGCGLLRDNKLESQIPKRNQLLLRNW